MYRFASHFSSHIALLVNKSIPRSPIRSKKNEIPVQDCVQKKIINILLVEGCEIKDYSIY
jgi:hypothetical protein